MNTRSQKERSNKWIPCNGLVRPDDTFQTERKDSLTVAWGHFRLIFLLYQTAALNYRIFLRSVSLPGPQPVSGITDARLECQAFLSGKKETPHPPLVDLFFFLNRRKSELLNPFSISYIAHCNMFVDSVSARHHYDTDIDCDIIKFWWHFHHWICGFFGCLNRWVFKRWYKTMSTETYIWIWSFCLILDSLLTLAQKTQITHTLCSRLFLVH